MNLPRKNYPQKTSLIKVKEHNKSSKNENISVRKLSLTIKKVTVFNYEIVPPFFS